MNTISAEDAKIIIESGNALVVDVRTADEFKEGHISGAQNIDVYEAAFEEEVNMLDKNTKYVVNCRSGGRSARAVSLMSELGFKNVTNLEGGIIAWEREGFSLEK